jgi:hypothetical protein
VPDGKPPSPEDLGRDADIIEMLLKRHEPIEIQDAIEGLAALRETGQLGSWIRPGEKATMRAIVKPDKPDHIKFWEQCTHAGRREH